MQLSKIGSVNTYIRCLKQLHEWKFLDYQPSFNSVVGSRVTLFIFDNAESNAEPVYTLYNNINNTNINKRVNGTLAPTFFEVEIYFKKKKENKKPSSTKKKIKKPIIFYGYNTGTR